MLKYYLQSFEQNYLQIESIPNLPIEFYCMFTILVFLLMELIKSKAPFYVILLFYSIKSFRFEFYFTPSVKTAA